MSIIGPFNKVPTGAVHILQSTGVNCDIVLGPINFSASGIATGIVPIANLPTGIISMSRHFIIMGG